MKRTLCEDDNKKFLRVLYFGNDKNTDTLDKCISKAYLDFCRTLHGFSSNKDNLKIRSLASKLLKDEIIKIIKISIYSQADFDNWHKDCCNRLISNYKDFKFSHGQAQKWINMTFKYMILLDYERIENVYEYLHIPIDNIVIDELNKLEKSGKIDKVPDIESSWSRMEYEPYIKFQKWFRDTFPEIPIEKEFKLWLYGSEFPDLPKAPSLIPKNEGPKIIRV